jgi:dihydroorotase
LRDAFAIPRPDDFHVHLRRGPSLAAYASRTAEVFGRALVMPNTLPPVRSAADIAAYRSEIGAAVPGSGFVPLMSFKLHAGMGPEAVRACAAAGAIAGKYYPAGATTNAEDGIADPRDIEAELAAMEDCGLVLSIHGEAPDAPVLEREAAFLPVVEGLLSRHASLKIVLEHISTRESLDFLRSGPSRLAASVTAHHLALCLDELLGGALDPHLFCKPVLKGSAHRDALREAVLGGEERLFFGSDSAPHPRAAKEGRKAASGIYAPTALPWLAGFFEDGRGPRGEAWTESLASFVSAKGAAFYGLEPPRAFLQLHREEWTVAEELDGAVPLFAGRVMRWMHWDRDEQKM